MCVIKHKGRSSNAASWSGSASEEPSFNSAAVWSVFLPVVFSFEATVSAWRFRVNLWQWCNQHRLNVLYDSANLICAVILSAFSLSVNCWEPEWRQDSDTSWKLTSERSRRDTFSAYSIPSSRHSYECLHKQWAQQGSHPPPALNHTSPKVHAAPTKKKKQQKNNMTP